jgi:hypothetical protein
MQDAPLRSSLRSFPANGILIGDLPEVFACGLIVSQSRFVFGFELAQIHGLTIDLDASAPAAAPLGQRYSSIGRGRLQPIFRQKLLPLLQSADDQIALTIIQLLIEAARINLFAFDGLHQKFTQGHVPSAIRPSDRSDHAQPAGGSFGDTPAVSLHPLQILVVDFHFAFTNRNRAPFFSRICLHSSIIHEDIFFDQRFVNGRCRSHYASL